MKNSPRNSIQKKSESRSWFKTNRRFGFKIHKMWTLFNIMTCKGVCSRYKADKPIGTTNRYSEGQKRCNRCDIFTTWEGVRCPCCGMVLRTRPRNSRHRIALMQTIKRVWNEIQTDLQQMWPVLCSWGVFTGFCKRFLGKVEPRSWWCHEMCSWVCVSRNWLIQ